MAITNQKKSMQLLWRDSYLSSGNEVYLEQQYETYLHDPSALTPEWRQFFDQMPRTSGRPDVSHAAVQEHFLALARQQVRMVFPGTMHAPKDQLQEKVLELIAAYRRLGHLRANIDPLGLMKPADNPILSLDYYGFTEADLNKTVQTAAYLALPQSEVKLSELHASLKRVYSGSIGFEYMHINRSDEVEWIRDRIENGYASFKPSAEEKKYLLARLAAADGLEKYLGFKYVGQKRFSLEGGDSLIPFMDAMINRAVANGVKEVTIGMAHRGRLNVLVNIVGKDPKELFAAFEGVHVNSQNSGDVKYHLGCSSDVIVPAGKVHIALAFNPSHLEIVSPVVQGSVRARQRRRRNTEMQEVMPIQIHGDSAFAGQGVVMETFNMSQARWFTVGGSIHVVVNNQVGFTTSNPRDTRSTLYCTDIAKMVEAPILHVNGSDPEAVYFAALFAADYRRTFKRDVVIDLVCYRRHGHNEADEPSATQPLMYKVIKSLQAPYIEYAKKLVAEGVINEGTEKQLADDYRAAMDAGRCVVNLNPDTAAYEFNVSWSPYLNKNWREPADTSLTAEKLLALGERLTVLPDGFVLQPQVKKTFENQKKMADGEMPINWGYGEILAYASLLDAGYPIRLCGQDVGRGTFSHRHAVLHDQNTDEVYIPLSHLSANQAQINIVDSLLSEEAVLAFEYGYATAEPNYLVIWEAQFGDFANGAQVVIDQFISSGEQKWSRLCGLVMLLPHGFEGQGPEHSSARLERYLQLCAQDNMQVCVPTTPAQIFHLLRRQMIRPCRKPLIIMSPKSLLRHPSAVSSLSDLTDQGFQLVIPEVDTLDAKKVDSVIFCAGKVYYELLEARRTRQLNNVAIVRIEQLYPFPESEVKAILDQYPNAKDIVWCQEEPENQGAWLTLQPCILAILKGQTLRYAGRASAAAPACGYLSVHVKEQNALIDLALTK